MENNRPLLIVGGPQLTSEGIITSALEAIAGDPGHWHPEWAGQYVRDVWAIQEQGLGGLAHRWAIRRGLPIESVSYEDALMGPVRPWGAIIMPGNATTGALLAACLAAGIPTVCVDPEEMNIFVADTSLVQDEVGSTRTGNEGVQSHPVVPPIDGELDGVADALELTNIDGSPFSPDSVSMPDEGYLETRASKAGKEQCKSTRSPVVKAG